MLVSINCWIETPNFSAITPNVSPASTTYFFPPIGAAEAEDDAAEAGATLADGGAEGGLLEGAAEAEALGLAETDGATLGVADRDGLAVPLTPAGVSVAAESREHAPRSNAPPSIVATRPRRKR